MRGREAKARSRIAVLAKLDAIDPAARVSLSRAIMEEVVGHSAYRSSTTVLAYASFGSEPETGSFLRHTLNEGKTLLPPRVDRRERTLEVYEVGDPVRDLEAGTWGIRDPRQNRGDLADPQAAEFVLVPGDAWAASPGTVRVPLARCMGCVRRRVVGDIGRARKA